MSYTVTVSGTTFTVGMSSVDYAVTLSQVGQQGAAGPTGISWLGAWALSTDFALRDVVSNNGSSHICIQAHTSSATDEPGVGANAATYWEVLAAKGVDGSGTGTVTSIDVAGGTGLTSSGGPVTSSGTITVALDVASQASLALADSALQPTGTVTLTGGFDSDEEALGIITSGTVTPEVDASGKENFKSLTNNGAFTLAPPSTSSACCIRIHVINAASAGPITTTGFDKVFDPDTYATTNAKEYFFYIDHNATRNVLTIREIV